ncbi:MAG: hypothetical protein COV96_01480 [Candidatus Zambryskibacteria bacterium CG11_big_fil_rev_8_21_14_0_20_42_18]|uniref:Uncharacterized protein n=1 Tax=Candidatus Zambryskibacteria bacterium CG_4_9_14_3_um_filter_42_15 TaxID=1975112 RepID=A0A2M7WRV0_9BACT|nr:MAG: hypothetical protein COV96_01480 [Candidatus Zambryskibacteria bacterium CG11_big_fil_rev_8_21_14_0_20_42_18]PJA32728.1 MAG: hypothetical protein CO185_01895 [Candidatus Zambryskibacteria bacterium CG_4_9_14_3_um_filter_42_15]
MQDFENVSFARKNVIWLVVLVAFVIFGVFLFKDWDKIVNDEIDGMATITGSFSCLPLKVGIVAEGEDCTLGIKSRENLYYALDISRIQDANTDLKVEDTIAVTGTLKPVEEILKPEWSAFNITAIILVNTLLRTK